MAYSIRVDPSARRATVSLDGRVDGRDLLAIIHAIFDDEAWEPGFDQIWDASDLSQLILGPDDIQRIVEQAQGYETQIGDGRTALVTLRDLDSAIARLIIHQQGSDRRERRLFGHIDDALAWLDGASAKARDTAA